MRLILAAAGLALVACSDLQFVAPGAVQTRMFIRASVTHDSQSRVEVRATLLPGRDADGRSEALSDSALYINGAKVIPLASELPSLAYEWNVEHATPSVVAESLLVLAPRLSSPPDSFQAVIGLPARLDARQLTLGTGVDLRLHVTPAAAVGIPPKASQSWQLSLRSSCVNGTTLLQVTATGPYPAELRVPWEQLPVTRPSTIEACFFSLASYTATLVPYRVDISVTMSAMWTLQLEP